MPRTKKCSTHARSRFARCLFTAVIAVLLLLALHGSSIAGTYNKEKQHNTNNNDHHATAERSATPLRSSLGTFAVPASSGSPVVSLQAACRTEMRLYCGEDVTPSPLRCLVEQYYLVKASADSPRRPSAFSDVCEAWLMARDACLSFVHAQGKELCGESAGDARECLRQIPAVLLPATCATSDYYESVRLVGKLRQHQTADARLRKIHGH